MNRDDVGAKGIDDFECDGGRERERDRESGREWRVLSTGGGSAEAPAGSVDSPMQWSLSDN